MNTVKLFAKFEIIPSEDIKQKVEAEMQSLLLSLTPKAKLNVISGHGCWWIEIIVDTIDLSMWFASQIVSWRLNKELDQRSEKDKKKIDLSDNSELPIPPAGILLSPEEQPLNHMFSQIDKDLIDKMNNLCENYWHYEVILASSYQLIR